MTDLTNTRWLINHPLTSLPTSHWSIKTYEKRYEYDWIIESAMNDKALFVGYGGDVEDYYYYATADESESSTDWSLSGDYVNYRFVQSEYGTYRYDSTQGIAARTLNIAGGTDATNTDLIAWLEANATQLPSFTHYAYIDSKAGDTARFKRYSSNYYKISANFTNCTATGGDTVIAFEKDTVSYRLSPNSGYYLNTSNITVTNAEYTLDESTKLLSISNPTGDVSVSVKCSANVFSITNNLTHCTSNSSNPTTLTYGQTATLQYTVESLYKFPDTVTVTNASYTWDSSTGILVLSNASGAVTVTIEAEYAVTQLTAPTAVFDVEAPFDVGNTRTNSLGQQLKITKTDSNTTGYKIFVYGSAANAALGQPNYTYDMSATKDTSTVLLATLLALESSIKGGAFWVGVAAISDSEYYTQSTVTMVDGIFHFYLPDLETASITGVADDGTVTAEIDDNTSNIIVLVDDVIVGDITDFTADGGGQ